MTKPAVILLCLTVITCMSSCGNQTNKSNETSENMHGTHKNIKDDFAHKNIIILEPPFIVSDSSKIEFEQALASYFSLRDALFEDNIPNADKAANTMLENIKNVPSSTFNEEQSNVWQQHKSLYKKTLTELLHIKSIAEKRSYFSHISEILYCSVKSFQFTEDPIYVAYCTMAFKGKGAFWLTSDKTIRNPYYGTNMPNCGEITEVVGNSKS